MHIKPIKTEQDYDLALERLEIIFDAELNTEEGDELGILSSSDLEKYRPYIFIIETIEYKDRVTLNNKRNDIVDFMNENDYIEYAFTGVNSIFIDKREFEGEIK